MMGSAPRSSKAVRISRERASWRGLSPSLVLAFTSAPFSSNNQTVSDRFFRRQTATYKGVKPHLSMRFTRPGLASTHCRSSASFMSQKLIFTATAAILPFLSLGTTLLRRVLEACVVCMRCVWERNFGVCEKDKHVLRDGSLRATLLVLCAVHLSRFTFCTLCLLVSFTATAAAAGNCWSCCCC